MGHFICSKRVLQMNTLQHSNLYALKWTMRTSDERTQNLSLRNTLKQMLEVKNNLQIEWPSAFTHFKNEFVECLFFFLLFYCEYNSVILN